MNKRLLIVAIVVPVIVVNLIFYMWSTSSSGFTEEKLQEEVQKELSRMKQAGVIYDKSYVEKMMADTKKSSKVPSKPKKQKKKKATGSSLAVIDDDEAAATKKKFTIDDTKDDTDYSDVEFLPDWDKQLAASKGKDWHKFTFSDALSKKKLYGKCKLGQYTEEEDKFYKAEEKDLYKNPNMIYVLHAESNVQWNPILKAVDAFNVPQYDVIASVIGSYTWINLLTKTSTKKVILFDLNIHVLEFMAYVLKLIKVTPTRQEYAASFYGREFDSFNKKYGFDKAAESKRQSDGRSHFLSKRMDKDIIEKTLKRLGPKSKEACTYMHVLARYMHNPLAGNLARGKKSPYRSFKRRVCETLDIGWNRRNKMWLHPGFDSGRDNQCSMEYGLMWLESDETYKRIRKILRASTIEFQHYNVLEEPLSKLDKDIATKNTLYFISNIDVQFESQIQKSFKSYHKILEDEDNGGGSLYLISLDQMKALYPTTHASKWGAIRPYVKGRKVVEVTHNVKFGFSEIENKESLFVRHFVKKSYSSIDTIVYHQIIGDGQSQSGGQSVWKRGFDLAKRIVIVEHNRDSKEFVGKEAKDNFKNFYKFADFKNVTKKLCTDAAKRKGKKCKVLEQRLVHGINTHDRNMVAVFDIV